jgi:ABC-2 type transport system ATP-binding protein
VHNPELVFLDEPTVGIDPQSRERIFEMVESLRARGTALVYTSHQLGEVEAQEHALDTSRGCKGVFPLWSAGAF